MNFFTLNFDQFNASLLNKSLLSFLNKNDPPILRTIGYSAFQIRNLSRNKLVLMLNTENIYKICVFSAVDEEWKFGCFVIPPVV